MEIEKRNISTSSEVWKKYPDYPLYEVSNRGRVRSWRKSGKGKGRRNKPRILKLNKQRGYYYTTITIDGERHTVRVHTWVNLAFNGDPPNENLQTLHKDDNKENNTPGNLYWGTPQDNADDRERNGRVAKGSKQGSSKLTENEVLEIRNAYRLDCFTQQEIADAYNVSRRTIGAVITKQNWRHL